MAAPARPLIGVYSGTDGKRVGQLPLPAVLTAPIRTDVVQFVFANINKNKRQPYAVSKMAGHQTSAESWGTGRAVSRIPRVPGGGTHRAGQAAFGNMCRGGRMFAPTKTWRRWHRRVNKNQRRFATCSALAASAIPALVMARGHKVEKLNEVPCVIADKTIVDIEKTAQAVKLLKAIGASEDVDRCRESKKIRAGKGKLRNRRYTLRRGPLVVYDQKSPCIKAFRNLPGVELCSVQRLNLLQLAPGGHVGRFVIWTESAFKKLDSIFGTYRKKSSVKKGFTLPHAVMTNASLTRIINSDEIQSRLRPAIKQTRKFIKKKNPLVNRGAMIKLNPFAETEKKRTVKALKQQKDKRIAVRKAMREGKKTKTVQRIEAGKSKRQTARSEATKMCVQFDDIKREEEKYNAAVAKAKEEGDECTYQRKELPTPKATIPRTNFYMRIFY
eukprot:CAMPEP_0177645052 /NCGR_PEP_ID=MMETSP0447-20121125/9038_1 /TAXON_ID=0 /ORGANISM="Stygamoeba regulata, Strain BSH-02190019" /LENGTH=441 /DNA_ID=CAMNT_0019147499 /DNA_START=20 /DNA_END=1345 /DNA_ORIENTATION=+